MKGAKFVFVLGPLLLCVFLLSACADAQAGGVVIEAADAASDDIWMHRSSVGYRLSDFKADGSVMPGGSTWYVIDCGGIKNSDLKNLYATLKLSAYPDITLIMPNITSLDQENFYGTFQFLPAKVKTIKLPQVTAVGNYAFFFNMGLTSIELPRAASIGVNALAVNSALVSLAIATKTTGDVTGEYALFGHDYQTILPANPPPTLHLTVGPGVQGINTVAGTWATKGSDGFNKGTYTFQSGITQLSAPLP